MPLSLSGLNLAGDLWLELKGSAGFSLLIYMLTGLPCSLSGAFLYLLPLFLRSDFRQELLVITGSKGDEDRVVLFIKHCCHTGNSH